MLNFLLNFKLPICSPKCLQHFMLLPATSRAWEFQFFFTFPTIVVTIHYSRCEILSHCGYNSYFLMTNDVEHLFMCLLLTICISLEISTLFLLSILKHVLTVNCLLPTLLCPLAVFVLLLLYCQVLQFSVAITIILVFLLLYKHKVYQ